MHHLGGDQFPGESGFAYLRPALNGRALSLLFDPSHCTAHQTTLSPNQTVLVAGHEMGHSLGMEHDGPQDSNQCNKDDFVMSPTLGPGKTTWSECSRQYLDKFVLTPQATCVLGRSSHVNIIQQFVPKHQLPGERFSVEDQCRFRFGGSARHHSGQPLHEICRVVRCQVRSHVKSSLMAGRALYQYPAKSTYNTHPALEGTTCGIKKVRL